MIVEDGKIKAFGAGIMSSVSRRWFIPLVTSPVKWYFDIADMIHLPYRTDIVQPVYFVIDSYEHLIQSGRYRKSIGRR